MWLYSTKIVFAKMGGGLDWTPRQLFADSWIRWGDSEHGEQWSAPGGRWLTFSGGTEDSTGHGHGIWNGRGGVMAATELSLAWSCRGCSSESPWSGGVLERWVSWDLRPNNWGRFCKKMDKKKMTKTKLGTGPQKKLREWQTLRFELD